MENVSSKLASKLALCPIARVVHLLASGVSSIVLARIYHDDDNDDDDDDYNDDDD
jgi:hypothetical protein